jgi:hypothetical protein
VVGMPVTLSLTRRLRSVYRVIYPGSGCRARHRWRGKSSGQRAPTYDFSTSSSTFTITWQGSLTGVAGGELCLDVGTAGGHHRGLTGSGLVAQDNGGTVLITEAASPFAGGASRPLRCLQLFSVMPRFTPPARHQPAAARR